MPQQLPATINEVLAELDRIIEQSIATNDARGIFASIYRRTTAEIKVAIEASEFGDSERLEQFDVAFANFYLKAYRDYEAGEECSQVWTESFEGCLERLSIVQHAMLGMNAHINIDLALTAATQAQGQDIQNLEADFLLVNDILQRLVNDMQNRLSRVSPLFFLLDWLGQNSDEKLIDFSMRQARAQAWHLAVDLHKSEGEAFHTNQHLADAAFSLFSKKLRKPNSKLLRWALDFIRRFEEKRVGKVVEKMSS